ncbi:hypothetical protein GN956_G13591 [Arapaima gigas]
MLKELLVFTEVKNNYMRKKPHCSSEFLSLCFGFRNSSCFKNLFLTHIKTLPGSFYDTSVWGGAAFCLQRPKDGLSLRSSGEML